MRVVDDDGNIIKTGDPETDAVSEPAESDWTEPVGFFANVVAKQRDVPQ